MSPQTPASQTLLEWHRTGRLASCFPGMPGMLAEVPDDELASVGRLLSQLDPDDVLGEHPATPVVTVAITGHGTLGQLTAPLAAELARHGMLMRALLSAFDGYVFDLSDPDSAVYAARPDLVLCVLDPMVVFDEIPVPWRSADAERALHDKLQMIGRLAAGFERHGHGTLVLNTMPLLRRFTAQIVDHRSRASVSAAWHEANAALLRMAVTHPAVEVLDLAPLLAEGIAAEDPRLSVYAKAHLSPALLARYARDVGHLARHVKGQTKKALAVDLDGTLWGGLLGEDGPDGIDVGSGYRGQAFRSFQRVIRQLGAQGVLLAAVSKNDPELVRAVFREHPQMPLREDDFVRISANWRPKHKNIIELAEALNLSTDSFVFVDDSSFECGLVRHALPGVAVVQVTEEPARHVERLLHDGWFDTRELTEEDRTRVSKYTDDLIRKDFLETFDSVEEYLRQLRITVHVATVRDDDVARVSQLTLRTNQFNLTAARLQPGDVHDLLTDPAALLLAVYSADRFGENGLVGAIFARRAEGDLHIENFLLSCRVFSRGIEQACLSVVLKHARAERAAKVLGIYRQTPKNGKVRDFYPRNGFVHVASEGPQMVFRHDLAEIPEPPQHICMVDTIGEPS